MRSRELANELLARMKRLDLIVEETGVDTIVLALLQELVSEAMLEGFKQAVEITLGK